MIRIWLWWLHLSLFLHLKNYKNNQEAMARQYDLGKSEPQSYEESTRKRILGCAKKYQGQKYFAWTSGTTHEPKQIFYTKKRLRDLQQTYVAQATLAYRCANLGRPVFYFLSSMAPDRSVSGLLALEPTPLWLEHFVLRDSIIYVPSVARLVKHYPQDALHLTLLLIVEPVLIAMANPSSLYTILENVQRDWSRIRSQMTGILGEDWLPEFRKRLGPVVDVRLKRLQKLLELPTSPSMKELLPELKMIYCWSGGYVQPFIDNLQQQLESIRPQFSPMFSMSTETVAYLIYPNISIDGGLPIYPGICYEFLLAGCEPTSDNLLKPWHLKPGHQYTMVVSDAFGLKRYRTNDLFECIGFKGQVPLILFQGREGLGYSFTGEKITDQQLLEVYKRIRKKIGMPGAMFTCFPKVNKGGVPGYVFVTDSQTKSSCITGEMFDEMLMEINEEYASKRRSERLVKPEVVIQSYDQLVIQLAQSDRRYIGASVAQFKPLPLYQVFWESLIDQERNVS